MADLSGLGDLVLTVGGDISPLESALNEIPDAAQGAAASIQAAFDAIPSAGEAESSLSALGAAVSNTGTEAAAAGEELSKMTEGVATGAGEAAASVETIPPALHDTAEAASEAGDQLKEFLAQGLELAGIAVSLEAIKEALTEVVASFQELQRAQISMTALSGSAEQANATIEQLKTLSLGDALSFPALLSASQRMQAFGISTSQMPQLLEAAANAAAVMGTSVDNVANRLDRIAISGALSARTMTQLGLSTHDLATAMGVADSAVTSAFKAMDQSGRIDVLVAALQKFQGVAAATAETLSGQWTTFKNSVEFALEGVGEALSGVLVAGVQAAQSSVVPGIQAMTQAFKDLGSVLGPIISAAIASFTQGMGDLLTVVSSGVSALVTLGKASNDSGISFAQLAHYVGDVTPWGLFSSSIHQAATDLQLLHAAEDMAAASALVMGARFDSVTDSLKTFIDKTSTGHDSLLGIRTDYEALQKAVTDAQTQLTLVQQAYDKGIASAGQLEAATKALTAAQTALNGTLDTSKLTMASIATAYDALKTALATANANLELVSKAYLDGKASITQYQAAVDALKTAQDALNGTMKLNPIEQVAADFAQLKTNLAEAQDKLQAVTAALAQGQASMGQYQSAVAGVNSAQQALTGSAIAATAAVSSSTPKVIEVASALSQATAAYTSVATAATSATTAVSGFVGPMQDSGNAIQVFAGSTMNAAAQVAQLTNGIQVLHGSVPTITSDFSSATTMITSFDSAMKTATTDAASFVNALNAVADAAQSTAGAVQQAGEAAQQAVTDFASIDTGAGATAPGAGDTGTTASLGSGSLKMTFAPGTEVTGSMPGPVGGGASSGYGQILGTPEQRLQAMINSIQAPQQLDSVLAQLNAALNPAAAQLTTAGTALTSAASTQQTAAQTAYDAAKLATIGANDTITAAQTLTTANDSISQASLAAADAANVQAMAGQALITAGSTLSTAATTITSASTSLVSAATNLTAAANATAAVNGASTFTMNTPTVGALPGVGTSGGMTGGLSPAVWAAAYQATVGGTGPQNAGVNLTVNAPGFITSLMNEFMRQLQSQGLMLRRN